MANATAGPARFLPSSGDYVVLESAAVRVNTSTPRTAQEVGQLASQYLDLARSKRDPRYFGRAEALLKPWMNRSEVSPDLLVLQADIWCPSLAGFNIGVDLAQLSIVLLVFPFLLRARSFRFYHVRLMPAMSAAVALAGAIWFVQRG